MDFTVIDFYCRLMKVPIKIGTVNHIRNILICLIELIWGLQGKMVYNYYLEVSEPKWVNPVDIQYGVDPLRLGDFHLD